MNFGKWGTLGNPPVVALQPSVDLGQCWPFQGNRGILTIQLPNKILPTHFKLAHVHPQLANDISSAPKDIKVWEIKEGTRGRLLAEFR